MKPRQNGFTIVEMIIVIIAIAILALITVFAFNNYRARTAKTEMKNELMQGAAASKNYRNFNNTYPVLATDFTAIHQSGGEVTLTYTPISAGVGYCLTATSVNLPSTPWYITNSIGEPTSTKPAGCP